MKAGTLLLVIADVIHVLETKGLITSEGNFGDFSNIENDVELVNAVEDVLIQHGLDVPEKVVSIVKLLPLIVKLAGV